MDSSYSSYHEEDVTPLLNFMVDKDKDMVKNCHLVVISTNHTQSAMEPQYQTLMDTTMDVLERCNNSASFVVRCVLLVRSVSTY